MGWKLRLRGAGCEVLDDLRDASLAVY